MARFVDTPLQNCRFIASYITRNNEVVRSGVRPGAYISLACARHLKWFVCLFLTLGSCSPHLLLHVQVVLLLLIVVLFSSELGCEVLALLLLLQLLRHLKMVLAQ